MRPVVLALLLALALASPSIAQRTSTVNVVYLKDGGVMRGTIIEERPGDHVLLRTTDGNVYSIAESRIDRITRDVGTVSSQNPSALQASRRSPIGAGATMLSGGLVFSSSSGDLYGSATQLQFNPSVKFLVAPGLAIGASGVLSRSSAGSSSLTSVGIGPSFVYFIGSPSVQGSAKGNAYPYLGVTALYTSLSGGGSSTVTGSSVAVGGGVLVMVSEGAGLTAEVSYQFDHMGTSGVSADGNRLNVILGFSAFLY